MNTKPSAWTRTRYGSSSKYKPGHKRAGDGYLKCSDPACCPPYRKVIACAVLAAFLSLPAFAAPVCQVNVNSATPQELQLLSRTGPVLAGRIVAGRPLDAAKLDGIKGIGEAWLTVNGPHVAYSGPTTCAEKIRAPKVAAQGPKL